VDDAARHAAEVTAALRAAGFAAAEAEVLEPSLEDVFIARLAALGLSAESAPRAGADA